MPASKYTPRSKIALALSPKELDAMCAAIAKAPLIKWPAIIRRECKKRGIKLGVGENGVYSFRNKVVVPYVERMRAREHLSAALREQKIGAEDSSRTLADEAAAETSFLMLEAVHQLDGKVNIHDPKHREILDVLSKGIARIRDGDRALMKQLKAENDELKKQQEAAKKIIEVDAKKKQSGISAQTREAIRAALGMQSPAAK